MISITVNGLEDFAVLQRILSVSDYDSVFPTDKGYDGNVSLCCPDDYQGVQKKYPIYMDGNGDVLCNLSSRSYGCTMQIIVPHKLNMGSSGIAYRVLEMAHSKLVSGMT